MGRISLSNAQLLNVRERERIKQKYYYSLVSPLRISTQTHTARATTTQWTASDHYRLTLTRFKKKTSLIIIFMTFILKCLNVDAVNL